MHIISQHLGDMAKYNTYRAVKDNAVTISPTFDVSGEVETDGPVTQRIHSLDIKEILGPR